MGPIDLFKFCYTLLVLNHSESLIRPTSYKLKCSEVNAQSAVLPNIEIYVYKVPMIMSLYDSFEEKMKNNFGKHMKSQGLLSPTTESKFNR